MTSVDLQDIVGMSRKNDSAILNKCLRMAASGLTKNRTLFTTESFAGFITMSYHTRRLNKVHLLLYMHQ